LDPDGVLPIDGGALFLVAACVAWALDNNLTHAASSADALLVAGTKGLVAGAANLGLATAMHQPLPPSSTAVALLLVGFVGYGLSLALFVAALRHLGAARTGAYFGVAPFVGVVVAVAVLGEPLAPQLVFAGVLMAIGLWLHVSERHEHEHTHEEQEHEHAHEHDEHHPHAHVPAVAGPHTHRHRHERLTHTHAHAPDLHHRHEH
jgi:drug/metabolite transporter (DMT)-like permease